MLRHGCQELFVALGFFRDRELADVHCACRHIVILRNSDQLHDSGKKEAPNGAVLGAWFLVGQTS